MIKFILKIAAVAMIMVVCVGNSYAQPIPLVELRPSDCGVDDFTTNSIIKSLKPPIGTNVTAYEWRFVELEAPFNTYEIISPNGSNPNFRLFWFPQIAYNRSYDVSVRIYVAGVPGAYGNVCEIGLQTNVLNTRLQSQFNNTIQNFCAVVSADPVGGATQYRWTFDDFENPPLEAFGDGSSRLLRLQSVPGLELGQTYVVRVFATVADVESIGGSLRFILMSNFVPNTGLNSNIYPCGLTYPVNTQVQAVEICSAQSYTWRFRNTSSSQPDIFYTRSDGSRWIRLDWIPDFIFGDSYDVDVRAMQGGLMGDFSSVCNITIEEPTTGFAGSDPTSIIAQSNAEADAELLGLSLHANQISGIGSDLNVTITNPVSERPVQLSLFDMNGRLVAQRQEAIFDQATFTWPTNNLNTGVYILRAENGVEVQSHKIVVF